LLPGKSLTGTCQIQYRITGCRLDIGEGLKCGTDGGSKITGLYTPPFAFTGNLEKVMVDVIGERIEDYEAEIRAALARQ